MRCRACTASCYQMAVTASVAGERYLLVCFCWACSVHVLAPICQTAFVAPRPHERELSGHERSTCAAVHALPERDGKRMEAADSEHPTHRARTGASQRRTALHKYLGWGDRDTLHTTVASSRAGVRCGTQLVRTGHPACSISTGEQGISQRKAIYYCCFFLNDCFFGRKSWRSKKFLSAASHPVPFFLPLSRAATGGAMPARVAALLLTCL